MSIEGARDLVRALITALSVVQAALLAIQKLLESSAGQRFFRHNAGGTHVPRD